MRKPDFHSVLRPVITLFGAAVGGGLAALGIQLYLVFGGPRVLSSGQVVWICIAATLLFAIVTWFAAPRLIRFVQRWSGAVEGSLSETPLAQVICGALGLVLGLVIATLVTQLFRVGLPELLWAGLSAILYLMLGYLGASLGSKRWREMPLVPGARQARAERRAAQGAPLPASKILDTSALIDGRIFDVCKTGFVEGPLVIPQFVLEELRHIADSGDPLRRNRGRRGLDVLARLQKELDISVQIMDLDFADAQEVDVKLLKLAREMRGVVVTNDFNLNKVADVTGVKVLNINDLAGALRPVLLPGEEMRVQVLREGKEPGQGVGYLDDGTMIIVDNGKRHIGETIDVVVTTVLQTSAGRMIFTRVKQVA